jgi:hypothetical protein
MSPLDRAPRLFFTALAVAYMMLVTLFAAAIARDSRGRADLMPILAGVRPRMKPRVG